MKFGYLIAASLLVVGTPARAAEPATPVTAPVAHTPEMDVRCFLAFRKMERALSEQKKGEAVQPYSFFYHGRASALFSADELKSLIIADAFTAKREDYPNLVAHCTAFIVQQAKSMDVIAEQIKTAKPWEIAEALRRKRERDAAAAAADTAESAGAAESGK